MCMNGDLWISYNEWIRFLAMRSHKKVVRSACIHCAMDSLSVRHGSVMAAGFGRNSAPGRYLCNTVPKSDKKPRRLGLGSQVS